MSFRKLNDGQKEKIKKRILKLLTEGLSLADACSQVEISHNGFWYWRKRDQMLGHHIALLLAKNKKDPAVDWRKLNRDELRNLKENIKRLFKEGLSSKEARAKVNLGRKSFKSLREQDQMLDHFIKMTYKEGRK